MKLLLKILIPVLVLIGSVFAAKTILENRPEPSTRPQFASVPAVEATKLAQSNYPVVIRTQGTVQPTQSSTLVAEVTGTVVELSDLFVVGGSFEAGDVLMQIDERDYTIALTQSEANLAQATAALQEESARGKLAKSEWESMQNGRKASSFMLRQPQLAAARANRDAARAQVDRAKLDLDRTRFVAPYSGRVLEKSVDQGQFVARGARLGQIYSTDSVDVRLPLSNRQLTFLDIPTSGAVPQSLLPNIELIAVVGGIEQKWTGKVVRAEGVDAATQQLNVIARIENPFAVGKPPLRIGQYVKANVAGRVLEDVFVLPRAALREDREVLLVNEESQLERREVVVAWSDAETVAISDGLEVGAVLVTTPLSTVTNGTPVSATVDGVAPPKREGRPGGIAGGGKPDGGKSDDGERGKVERGEGSSQRGQSADNENEAEPQSMRKAPEADQQEANEQSDEPTASDATPSDATTSEVTVNEATNEVTSSIKKVATDTAAAVSDPTKAAKAAIAESAALKKSVASIVDRSAETEYK